MIKDIQRYWLGQILFIAGLILTAMVVLSISNSEAILPFECLKVIPCATLQAWGLYEISKSIR